MSFTYGFIKRAMQHGVGQEDAMHMANDPSHARRMDLLKRLMVAGGLLTGAGLVAHDQYQMHQPIPMNVDAMTEEHGP